MFQDIYLFFKFQLHILGINRKQQKKIIFSETDVFITKKRGTTDLKVSQ